METPSEVSVYLSAAKYFYAVFAVLSAAGVVCNSCLLFTTVRSKSLRAPCNILIGSCALFDVIHQLGTFTQSTQIYRGETMNSWTCSVMMFLPEMGVAAGSFAVLSIGIDRFASISMPNRYRSMNVTAYLLIHYLAIGLFCAYNAFLIFYFYRDHTAFSEVICNMPSVFHDNAVCWWAYSSAAVNVFAFGVYALTWRLIRKQSATLEVQKLRRLFRTIVLVTIFDLSGWAITQILVATQNLIDLPGGNYSCRKCRYDRIIQALNDSKSPRDDDIDNGEDNDASFPSSSNSIQSSHAPVLPETESLPKFKIIESIRRGHSVMNEIQREGELKMRNCVPDRKGFVADDMVVIPATYKLFNENTRILVSAMFEFASTSFEEFKTLEHDDQWLLIRNFYPFIMILNWEYRMNKFLSEKETMILLTYGIYIDHDTVEYFFSDSGSDRNSEDSRKFVHDYLDGDSRQNRDKMRRWNPSENEFLAFLGICFWSLDEVNVSDKVHRLAEKYRKLLFFELDKLYRLDASRMGEAILFIASVQGTVGELRSKLGVLKLLDVIWVEMLMAQLLQ